MSGAASPSAYWEHRARQFASQGRGLAAVCSYGMPSFYNGYIEACQRRALSPWLPRVSPGTSRALDVGCGIGRWSKELAARGHEVTGFDLSPYMIEQARRQAGGRCAFEVGDVAALRLNRRFDFILCVTVVQHVTDSARALESIRRLAEHLTPSGRLVMLEAAPSFPITRCDTQVFTARSLEWHAHAFHEARLKLVALSGVDPTPLKTWLLPHYRRMPKWLGNVALAATTAASLPADLLLAKRLTAFSWHKVLVAERLDAAEAAERREPIA